MGQVSGDINEILLYFFSYDIILHIYSKIEPYVCIALHNVILIIIVHHRIVWTLIKE